MKKKHTKRRNKNKRYKLSRKKGGVKLFGMDLGRMVPICKGNDYVSHLQVKTLFDELNERGRTLHEGYYQIVSIFSKNCPLLAEYIRFWNTNKSQLIDIYDLQGERTNESRFVDFLFIEYVRNRLRGNLELEEMRSFATRKKTEFDTTEL